MNGTSRSKITNPHPPEDIKDRAHHCDPPPVPSWSLAISRTISPHPAIYTSDPPHPVSVSHPPLYPVAAARAPAPSAHHTCAHPHRRRASRTTLAAPTSPPFHLHPPLFPPASASLPFHLNPNLNLVRSIRSCRSCFTPAYSGHTIPCYPIPIPYHTVTLSTKKSRLRRFNARISLELERRCICTGLQPPGAQKRRTKTGCRRGAELTPHHHTTHARTHARETVRYRTVQYVQTPHRTAYSNPRSSPAGRPIALHPPPPTRLMRHDLVG